MRVYALGTVRLAPTIGFVCLVLAGCGSGDDDPPDSGGGGTATATAAPVDRASDERLAEEALLVLGDLPAYWTSVDQGGADIPRCDAVRKVRETTTARGDSDRFAKGEGTGAQAAIYVFADEQAAEDGFTRLSSPETVACAADGLAGELARTSTGTVGRAATAPLEIDAHGDQSDATRVTVPLSAAGIEADLHIDLLYVRTGRALSLGLFLNVGSPFDDALREQLTAIGVERLTDALG